VTRDDLDDALDAVMAAAIAYRGDLTNEDGSTDTHAPGHQPWTPIYRQLLAELRSIVHAADHRYDEHTDARPNRAGRPIRLAR